MTGVRDVNESSRSSKRLRPRLTFGLKMGLVAVTVVCVWLAREHTRAQRQQQATTSIRRSGGVITFSDRFARGEARFLNPLSVVPDWLTWLSEDYFKRSQQVDFVIKRDASPSVTDEDLVLLDGVPDLRELLLGHNTSVGDNGVRHVSRLHKLEGLDLRNTAITDDGVQAIAKLRNLKWLLLNNTAVTDIGIDDLSSLGTNVSLYGCDKLQKMLPNCRIARQNERRAVLHKILELGGKIDFQPTVATLPIGFDEMHNEFAEVHRIVVRSLAFTDDDMTKLKSITELRSLDLSDTSVSDNGVSIVPYLRNLERLSLSNQKITDAGVGDIRQLTNLKVLGLRSSRVSDEGMAILAEMPRLERLYVSSPLITDNGVKHLGRITNLKELQLGGNLAGLEFDNLSTLKFLEELSLSNTRINDLAVAGLSTIRQLTFLSVGGTDISEAGVETLKSNLPTTRVMYWQNKN